MATPNKYNCSEVEIGLWACVEKAITTEAEKAGSSAKK